MPPPRPRRRARRSARRPSAPRRRSFGDLFGQLERPRRVERPEPVEQHTPGVARRPIFTYASPRYRAPRGTRAEGAGPRRRRRATRRSAPGCGAHSPARSRRRQSRREIRSPGGRRPPRRASSGRRSRANAAVVLAGRAGFGRRLTALLDGGRTGIGRDARPRREGRHRRDERQGQHAASQTHHGGALAPQAEGGASTLPAPTWMYRSRARGLPSAPPAAASRTHRRGSGRRAVGSGCRRC